MSLKTIGELKDSVSGILSGTNLDKVTNLYTAFERAARKLVQNADIPEATIKESIVFYDGVYDYEISENIFGGGLVDIQPQGITRTFLDDVQKMPVAQFDQSKWNLPSGYKVTFEWRDGTPIMRVSSSRPLPGVFLDSMKEITGWVGAGSASTPTLDRSVYYEAPASLKFTLTGSSTGSLTKTITQTDLTDYEDVGVIFLALEIPPGATATNLTSIQVRLGSSASDYDSVTATEGFLGAWVAGEWLLVAFDMATSTSTGTPDWTELDYVQVNFAHTATLTNMRVGGLWIAQPAPHNVIFQTSAIFLNPTTGVRIKNIVDDNTEIVLNDASFLLYEHESALAIALQGKQDKQIQQLRSTLNTGEGDDTSLYEKYRGDNPSQELRTVGSYYEEL